MADHNVFCVKLKKELPGLEEPPFDSPLGQKVYDNVSQEAWRGWTEFCKMLLNEYRLNPARREDQEVIVKQMEQYFFGEGSAPPKSTCRQRNKHSSLSHQHSALKPPIATDFCTAGRMPALQNCMPSAEC